MILQFPFIGNNALNAGPVSVLFLMNCISLIKLLTRVFGQLLQSVLINRSRSLMLFLVLLKSGKSHIQLLIHILIAQKLNRSFEDLSRGLNPVAMLLESRIADPIFRLRMNAYQPLVDVPSPVNFFIAQLEFNVRVPRLLIWLPFHPALEDLPAARDVSQHLLHVRVFVPELVGTRQNGGCAVEQVSSVVYLLVSHLHLGVLEPDGYGAVVHVQRAFPNGASADDLLLRLFPLGVFDPVGQVETVAADVVFELAPLLQTERCDLFWIAEFLFRRLKECNSGISVRLGSEKSLLTGGTYSS